jgi:hypothetical protein
MRTLVDLWFNVIYLFWKCNTYGQNNALWRLVYQTFYGEKFYKMIDSSMLTN